MHKCALHKLGPRGGAAHPPLCATLRDHASLSTAQASLFALTQCLPGPSSTQLATALGGLQAGLPGAIAAFVCFDLPGFVVLATSGITLRMYKDAEFDEGMMDVLATMQKGLGAASVGLLCHAALTIVKKCAPDPLTKKLALLSAVAATLINSALLFPILLLLGGIATRAAAKPGPSSQGGGTKPADSEAGGDKAALLSKSEKAGAQKGLPKPLGVALFLVWAVLLLVLWAWADLPGAPRMVRLSCAFFRTGSLVWGGGQVVLPMLLRELVYTQSAEHWLTEADFVRGFGLVQACCNPSLQPHAPRPATPRTPACNPTHHGLHPDAPQPATQPATQCNPRTGDARPRLQPLCFPRRRRRRSAGRPVGVG